MRRAVLRPVCTVTALGGSPHAAREKRTSPLHLESLLASICTPAGARVAAMRLRLVRCVRFARLCSIVAASLAGHDAACQTARRRDLIPAGPSPCTASRSFCEWSNGPSENDTRRTASHP